MRRKALIKHAPSTRKLTLSSLAGKAHFHFCQDRECRLIYEDACRTPLVNGRCHVCRGTHRPVWMSDRDPHECCLDNCTQVLSNDDLLRYELAGPGPWFQCNDCRRAHGWPCTT